MRLLRVDTKRDCAPKNQKRFPLSKRFGGLSIHDKGRVSIRNVSKSSVASVLVTLIYKRNANSLRLPWNLTKRSTAARYGVIITEQYAYPALRVLTG